MDRLELLKAELNRRMLQEIAEDLDLSYSCLWAIREGKTKWPRLKTLNKLLPYLELEISIVQKEQ